MKKIFVIGLFLTGVSIMSPGQSAPTTKQETNKEAHKKLMADLNLTADQSKQMKEVNMDFKDKAKIIKDNQSLSRKERKQQFTALAKERTDKINSFLTPDQQATLKEDKKEGRKRKA